MNPLLLLRAVGSLALPAALAFGALRRRAKRDIPPSRDAAGDAPTSTLCHMSRRALRTHLAHGGSLVDVELRRANLSGLTLHGHDLTGRDLTSANLRAANLSGVTITGCTLDHADCSKARFRGVDFTGVSVLETDLSDADLSGADLRGVRQLAMANLKRAAADRATCWPGGQDPRPHNLRL